MGRGLLLLVSGFLIIFGMVQNSVQNRQKSLAERSPNYFYEEQSRNIAASTLEVALKRLNDDAADPLKTLSDPCLSIKDDNILYNEESLNGKGKIDCYKPTPQSFFNSRIYLEIKGISGPADDQTITTIHAVANRPAFSIYSYFTIEEPVIYFADGDVLNGPVHTNGTFHIDGDPIFNGRVSSPNSPIKEYGSDPEYNGGYDFNADPIELPEDLAKLSNEASDGGLHFDDDKIKVEFKSDGTADITRYQKTGTERGDCLQGFGNYCFRYEEIPTYEPINSTPQNEDLTHSSDFNGIISSSGKVEVKGTLKGNITLHSKKDIKIIGDITYPDFDPGHPNAELSSSNLLGIISEGNVIVDKNAHKDHGNKDVNITASVMAMGESFEVEDYNSGSHRGQLRILGGLIQKKRGAVGTGGGTGYDKYYTYDKRLLNNSTPDFPKVKRFNIDSWNEITKKASAY